MRRHGLYKQDLQQFAKAMMKADKFPLLMEQPPTPEPAFDAETTSRIADRVVAEAKKKGLDVRVTKGARPAPNGKGPRRRPPAGR